MSFYEYRQNNSGGSFDVRPADGISQYVIVEADDAKEADYLAERIGLYFDGDGDCSCCGERWSAQDSWYSGDDGDEVPSNYGTPLVYHEKDNVFLLHSTWSGWIEGPDGYVHYKDGRIVPVVLVVTDGSWNSPRPSDEDILKSYEGQKDE